MILTFLCTLDFLADLHVPRCTVVLHLEELLSSTYHLFLLLLLVIIILGFL